MSTTMSEAFKRAGKKPASVRLRALAEKQLARFKDEQTALPSFYGVVVGDAKLLVALASEDYLRAAAMHYLRRVAAETVGEGGHVPDDAQKAIAPGPGDEGGGQVSSDTHVQGASPASQTNGGGHPRADIQSTDAPAGSEGGSGHPAGDTHLASAAPPREPSSIQKAAARDGALELARSVSQRFHVKTLNGQLLPNVHPSAYERMEKRGGKEQALAWMLAAWRDRKVAVLPPNAVTGDFIPRETLDLMVETAEHVVEHGIHFAGGQALLEYMETRNAR